MNSEADGSGVALTTFISLGFSSLNARISTKSAKPSAQSGRWLRWPSKPAKSTILRILTETNSKSTKSTENGIGFNQIHHKIAVCQNIAWFLYSLKDGKHTLLANTILKLFIYSLVFIWYLWSQAMILHTRYLQSMCLQLLLFATLSQAFSAIVTAVCRPSLRLKKFQIPQTSFIYCCLTEASRWRMISLGILNPCASIASVTRAKFWFITRILKRSNLKPT